MSGERMRGLWHGNGERAPWGIVGILVGIWCAYAASRALPLTRTVHIIAAWAAACLILLTAINYLVGLWRARKRSKDSESGEQVE